MKVRDTVMSREVVVLIDSSASHNFISNDLVAELSINQIPTQEFGVQMGNEDEIRASGVCRGLRLQLAEMKVVADFFPLKLGASDIVLGFQWLVTLGDSLMTWGNLCLQFTVDGVLVKIQGDPTLSKLQASLHSLIHTLKRERQGILLELQLDVAEGKNEADLISTHPLPPSVIQLLKEFHATYKSSPSSHQGALHHSAPGDLTHFSTTQPISSNPED